MADEKIKFGAGHAQAMARLGLRELREAVNPSKEGIAREEMGLYGTLTPGEIAQQKEAPEYDPLLDQEQRLKDLHSLMSQPPSQQQEQVKDRELTR